MSSEKGPSGETPAYLSPSPGTPLLQLSIAAMQRCLGAFALPCPDGFFGSPHRSREVPASAVEQQRGASTGPGLGSPWDLGCFSTCHCLAFLLLKAEKQPTCCRREAPPGDAPKLVFEAVETCWCSCLPYCKVRTGLL